MFGGNSNWRGPIWLPTNMLLIESLYEFHRYYGDDFTVECPTGSGRQRTLRQVADELSRRLTRLSLLGPDGRRPVMAAYPKLQGGRRRGLAGAVPRVLRRRQRPRRRRLAPDRVERAGRPAAGTARGGPGREPAGRQPRLSVVAGPPVPAPTCPAVGPGETVALRFCHRKHPIQAHLAGQRTGSDAGWVESMR